MGKSGFTLIEMSIVLVIIGLVVGGILTGQNLIDAAAQRAQIAQIDKYNTAVTTFQLKYNYLPGDIPAPAATRYGFQPRGTLIGEGDGNGVLQSNCQNNTVTGDTNGGQNCGEVVVFWEDLSEANLIDTTIYGHDTKGANYPYILGPVSSHRTLATTPSIKDWLPTAKIGSNVFVYVYSFAGINYFSVSTITTLNWDLQSTANPGLTVQQTYNIDNKIDDGLPQSGSVTACYINYNIVNYSYIWAAGGLQQGASGGTTYDPGYFGNYGYTNSCVSTTAATPYAARNCFDNNNTAGTQTYSISKNANVQNCALSFQFQTQ